MTQFWITLAVVAFVLWLVLTLSGVLLGGLVHLLWAVILLAIIIAAWQGLTRPGTTL